MTEEEIEVEVQKEQEKKFADLAKDIVREANTVPKNTAGEKENLDTIKHLVKRLAIHQLMLEKKANTTNRILIVLAIISAIGSISSVLSYL